MRGLLVAGIAAGLLLAPSAARPDPLRSAFSYQGVLRQDGQPANGRYDFLVELYATPAEIEAALCVVVVDDTVSDGGVFTLEPDCGQLVFDGQRLFLQLSVRPGASTGSYTPLLPRQEITGVPYAHRAIDSNALGGVTPTMYARRDAPNTFTAPLVLQGTMTAGGYTRFLDRVDFVGELSLLAPFGTPPFTVASSTRVDNLNADRLDGVSIEVLARTDGPNTFTEPLVLQGTVTASAYTRFQNSVDFGTVLHMLEPTGTPPFTVASSTRVDNLNADRVDGVSIEVIARTDASNAFLDVTQFQGPTTFATAPQFAAAAPTPPFSVASATQVANLNAAMLGGMTAAQIQAAALAVALDRLRPRVTESDGSQFPCQQVAGALVCGTTQCPPFLHDCDTIPPQFAECQAACFDNDKPGRFTALGFDLGPAGVQRVVHAQLVGPRLWCNNVTMPADAKLDLRLVLTGPPETVVIRREVLAQLEALVFQQPRLDFALTGFSFESQLSGPVKLDVQVQMQLTLQVACWFTPPPSGQTEPPFNLRVSASEAIVGG